MSLNVKIINIHAVTPDSYRVVGDSRPANYTRIYHLRRYIIRYLLITFFRKPGGQIDEQVAVSRRVKPADLQMCNVILDYGTKQVQKCVIEGKVVETDFEKMNAYYKNVYPNLIEQLQKEAAMTAQADKSGT